MISKACALVRQLSPYSSPHSVRGRREPTLALTSQQCERDGQDKKSPGADVDEADRGSSGVMAAREITAGIQVQAVVPSQVVAAILKLFPLAQEPRAVTLQSHQLPELMTIVRLVRRVPPQLFTIPIERYIDLELAIEVIEQSLEQRQREQYAFTIVPIDAGSVIQVIYKVLTDCHGSVPASSAANLAFIMEAKTRDTISREIGSIESALRNGEWKAATALTGAVIEALLLWRLEQFPKQEIIDAVDRCFSTRTLKHRPKPDVLLQWTLPEMIETSAELRVLGPNTVTEARQCKDFRNLIHPGRVLALEAECNRGTAFSAAAALDFVVTDLAWP
jgi:hypothetical protein